MAPKRSRVITMSPLVLNQEDDLDLDLWEVVNHSDGEYSADSFSVDSLSDDDVKSLDDDASFVPPSFISPPPPPQILTETDGGDITTDLVLDDQVDVDGDGDDVFRDEVDDDDLGWARRPMVVLRGGSHYSLGITLGDYAKRGGCYDDGEYDDHDGGYDDLYDLDEELVPAKRMQEARETEDEETGEKSNGQGLDLEDVSVFPLETWLRSR